MPFPRRHILVGTDFSGASQHAVDRAIELARQCSARLTLQHIVASAFWGDVIDSTTSAARVDLMSCAAAEAQAREALQRHAVEIASVLAQPCAIEVGTGRAPHELALAARNLGVDLVVIGAHGARRVRELVVGTTAQKLLHLSPGPALVVMRAPTADYRTVLAPTDFSPAFELPYDGLARHARVDPSTLRIYQRDAHKNLHPRLLAFADEAGVTATRRVLRIDHGYPAGRLDRHDRRRPRGDRRTWSFGSRRGAARQRQPAQSPGCARRACGRPLNARPQRTTITDRKSVV